MFKLNDSSEKPLLNTIYTLSLNSLGKIHFASLLKNSDSEEQFGNVINSFEQLLKLVDVFYCDDRGVI